MRAFLLMCCVSSIACHGPDKCFDSDGRVDTVDTVGAVVINEFLPNPEGADAGQEWIELYNPGSGTVDLSGWYFQSYKSETSVKESSGIPEDTLLDPGEFLLVGGEAVEDTDVTLETDLGSGADGDGVLLVDTYGSVIDAVVFGDSNEDAAPDETGAASPTFASKTGDGESLARCEDGRDTDASGSDFFLRTTDQITPGASNACESPCVTPAGDVVLVLNEVMPNPDGADAGLEWIEVYNAGTTDACLDTWVISGYRSDPLAHSGTATIPTGTLVPAGGVVLLGAATLEGVDSIVSLDLGNGSKGDAIYLIDYEETFEDGIVYGSTNDDGILDAPGGSVATSLAAPPGDGEALARCPDGTDTDASSVDFRLLEAGQETPGELNGTCEVVLPPDECSTVGGVTIVINEFVAALEGGDEGKEWVELYNAGSADADLSGWVLEWYKSSPTSPSGDFALPLGTTLAPGAVLVVGGSGAEAPVDVIGTLDLGSGIDGDGLHLLDCAGALADAVVYGGSNEHGILDESGLAASSVAVKPGEGEALARCPDGLDSDASGDDFSLIEAGGETPGDLNGACEVGTAECSTSDGVTIVINEFVADLKDGDEGKEWVELYNAGSTDADLSGWTLEWYKSSPTSRSGAFSLPEGSLLAAGDFLVIAEDAAGVPTDVTASLDLGNGPSGDGLHLLDCGGVLADAVVYGDGNEDGILDESGLAASSVAEMPGEEEALGRSPDGWDTNASGDDLCVIAPSADAPNGSCE